MKILISYILIIIFALPLLINGSLALNYFFHHDCDEKEEKCSKVEICCNNKCELVKKIKDSNSNNFKQINLIKKLTESKDLYFISTNTKINFVTDKFHESPKFSYFTFSLLKDFSKDIFDPPICKINFPSIF